MSIPGPSGSVPQAATLRVLAVALGTAPLLLVAVLAFVLPTSWDDEPPVLVVLGLVVLAGIGFLSAEAIGFHTEPLDASAARSVADAQRESVARFQTTMMLRFALTEMPILVGLAVSFVLDDGIWPLLVSAAVGLPVMWFEIWPGRRNAAKLATRLEAGGVRSWLPEALGVS